MAAGNRPEWNEYFMRFALLACTRSSCLRRRVGAVFVHDRQVLTTGYNGAPRSLPHCNAELCIRAEQNVPSGTRQELCRGLHAEQNALIQAARVGTSVLGADLFTTHHPCSTCAKMLLNAGVGRVFYAASYPDELGVQLLEEGGVEMIHLPMPAVDDDQLISESTLLDRDGPR